MNNYARHTILTLCLILAPLWSQSLKDQAEDELRTMYGSDVTLTYQKISVTDEMRKEAVQKTGQNYFFTYLYHWMVYKGDSLVGHAFVDNVYGKQMPITFMVVFNTDLKIINNSIIKYREIKGRAVKSREWLDSFIGKNSESTIEYGVSIDALSGSTISGKNLTKGVKKLTYLVNQVHADVVASLKSGDDSPEDLLNNKD